MRKRNRTAAFGLLAAVYTIVVALALYAPKLDTSDAQNSVIDARQLILGTSVRASGYPNGFCTGPTPKNHLRSSNKVWLVLLLPLILFCFAGLAVVTDDYFVPALERIVSDFNVSEDVAGATFMAAGSSAPELFTSMISTLFEGDDLGIGTIVGSAVFNICVIIAVSAMFAPCAILLDFRPLLRDSIFYVISVGLMLVFVLFSSKGTALYWEGLILLLAYVAYVLFMKYGNKPYMKLLAKKPIETVEDGNVFDNDDTSTVTDLDVVKQVDDDFTFDVLDLQDLSLEQITDEDHYENTENVKRFLDVPLPGNAAEWVTFPFFFPWRFLFVWTIPDCSGNYYDAEWHFKIAGKTPPKWIGTFTISILWVMGISYVMVEAARIAGCFIGIPSAVMGLTFLAAGTSVPDALASISVVKKCRGDMAVSNAIGSNVFDVLVGLGLPWFIGGLVKSTGVKITVTPLTEVVIPIAILFAIIILLLAILPLFKWKLGRPLGYFLLTVYAAFVTYSLLNVFVLNKKPI